MERFTPQFNYLPLKLISLKVFPVAGPGPWLLLFKFAGMTLEADAGMSGIQADFRAVRCP